MVGELRLRYGQVVLLVIMINCMCFGVLLIIMWQTQSWILEQKKTKFMGFSKGVNGYRLWCQETSKIVNSRDVTFDESGMFLQKIENNDEALKQVEKVVFSPDMVALTEEPIDQVDNNSDILEQEEQSLVNEKVEKPESIAKNRPRRVIRKPVRFDNTAYAFSMIDGVPNIRIEAWGGSNQLRYQLGDIMTRWRWL